MNKPLFLILLFSVFFQYLNAQDLAWNTTTPIYVNGSLSHNYTPAIGSPGSVVSLTVSDPANVRNGGSPAKFTASPNGVGCATCGALRSQITFTNLSQTLTYTFNFSPGVSNISFTIYDIDGDNTSGDQAIVTAQNGATPVNITMTTPDAGATITGSGTNTATATGTGGNLTDPRVDVSIGAGITTLTVVYRNNPANPTPGARSFSIGDISWMGLLPVRWLSFVGHYIADGSIELKWATANETMNDHFEIERSKDGQNFSKVASVNAAAPQNSSISYRYADASPAGNTFYRIKQIDLSNQIHYSSIIVIQSSKKGVPAISVFPNPALNYIFIAVSNNALLNQVQLIDATGKIVFQKNEPDNKIDISSLAKGMYLVRCQNKDGEIFTQSFIKK